MTNDNPYQSPHEPNVAAPWRQWQVWWAASALMFAIVLPFLLKEPWSGGLLFFGAAGVSLRTLFDLQRKSLAGWSISPLQQLSSLGQSVLLVIAAAIGSSIAFMITCTGMAIATEAPFWHAPVGESQLVTIVIGTAYLAMVVTFGGLVWLMGPPSLEKLRKMNPHQAEVPPRELEGGPNDR